MTFTKSENIFSLFMVRTFTEESTELTLTRDLRRSGCTRRLAHSNSLKETSSLSRELLGLYLKDSDYMKGLICIPLRGTLGISRQCRRLPRSSLRLQP